MMWLRKSALVAARGAGAVAPIVRAARSAALATLCAAAFAFGPLLTLSAAQAQPALTASQSDALNRYNKALSDFKSILSQRRAQIDAKQPLPDLPGQALYLPQRRDEHVQGSHRRIAGKNRATEQIREFRRPISMPTASR